MFVACAARVSEWCAMRKAGLAAGQAPNADARTSASASARKRVEVSHHSRHFEVTEGVEAVQASWAV